MKKRIAPPDLYCPVHGSRLAPLESGFVIELKDGSRVIPEWGLSPTEVFILDARAKSLLGQVIMLCTEDGIRWQFQVDGDLLVIAEWPPD